MAPTPTKAKAASASPPLLSAKNAGDSLKSRLPLQSASSASKASLAAPMCLTTTTAEAGAAQPAAGRLENKALAQSYGSTLASLPHSAHQRSPEAVTPKTLSSGHAALATKLTMTGATRERLSSPGLASTFLGPRLTSNLLGPRLTSNLLGPRPAPSHMAVPPHTTTPLVNKAIVSSAVPASHAAGPASLAAASTKMKPSSNVQATPRLANPALRTAAVPATATHGSASLAAHTVLTSATPAAMLAKTQGGAVMRSSQLRATPVRSAPTVPPTGTAIDEAPLINYDLEDLQLPFDGISQPLDGADPRQKETAVIEAFEASLERHRLSQQGRAHRKHARDTTAIKLTLINAVAASLIGGPDFYDRLNPTRQRLVELCDSLLATDPEFVLKVAVYTRQHLNIRTTANFLLALAANRRRCRKYLRKYFGDSVRLPSDWIEVAQLSQTFYNGSINYGSLPSALRKAMVAKFTDFDEYQLAKYNKEGKRKDRRTVSAHEAKAKGEAALMNGGEAASSGGGGAGDSADDDRYTRTTSSRSEDELELEKLTFSLKQLIRKLHVREPSHLVMAVLGKHYPESPQAFQRARLEGEWDPDRAGERMKLAVPKTWETQISLYGNTAAVWEELIASHKLPYMAMLRNIRNLIKAEVSEKAHDEVLSRLPDPRAVASSRQFPFRYFSAYEAIGQVEQEPQGKRKTISNMVRRYRKALDEAVIQATRLNVTPIPGSTVVFVDVSDSLRVPCTSARGLGKPREVLEVGILLGLMCKYAAEQCYLVLFSDVAAPQLLTVMEGTILENMECVLQTVEEMRAPYLSWGDMATASPGSTFHLATRSSSSPGDGAETDRKSDTCEVLLHNAFVKLQREGKTEDSGSGSSASSSAGFPLAAIEVLLENNVVLKNVLVLGGSDTLPPGLAHLLVRYRRIVNPETLCVNVNLSSKRQAVLDEDACQDFEPRNVYLAGYSDAILRFVAERGEGSGLVDFVSRIDELRGLAAKDAEAPRVKVAASLTRRKVQRKTHKPAGPPLAPATLQAPGLLPFPTLPKELDTDFNAGGWRSVRVFISSTFRDMHGERDLLTRFIFPELRKRARRLRIHIYEVDLRWGITEAEARQKSAVAACLEEVSRCHLFLGLLGDRYGWVPSESDLPEGPEFAWIRHLDQGTPQSVTALEFEAGAFAHMRSRADHERPCAFVATRSRNFGQLVPADYHSDFFETASEHRKALGNLVETAEHLKIPLLRDYDASWGGVREGRPVAKDLQVLGRWTLHQLWSAILQCSFETLPLDVDPSVSAPAIDVSEPTSQDMKRTVSFNEQTESGAKASASHSKPSLRRRGPGPEAPSDAASAQLVNLASGFVGRTDTVTALKRALRQIALAKELDDDAEPPLESDVRAKSAASHGHARTNTLSPHGDAGQGSSPVIIQGEAGAGKSALLALVAVEHARQYGWRNVLADLPAGTTGAGRDVTTVAQGWVRHLARSFDLWSTAPDNLGTLPLHTLFNVLGEMLRQATEQLHEGAFILLAIDAVDGLLTKGAKGQGQHSSAALDVGEMVGRHLPPKTVLVLSTRHTRNVARRGGGDAARSTGVLPPVILSLRGLSMADKASITRAVLARYGKRLAEDTFDNQLVALTTKRGAQNPLYLRLACEDLRQAANFEGLGQHIRQLPSDVTDLFGAVLRRLELDVGRDVVSRAVCLLLHAPEGLTEADIVDLLAGRAWHNHSAAASLLHTLHILAAPAKRGLPGLSGLSGSQQGAAATPAAAMAADILTHWVMAGSQLQAAQLLRQLSPFLATGEAEAEAATGADASRLALLNPALRSACEQRYLGNGAGSGSGRRDDQRKALAMAAHGMLAAHAASQADPRDDMSFGDAEGAALVTLLTHMDALHELCGTASMSKGFSVEGLAGNFAFLVAAAASGAETLDGIHDVFSASLGGKSDSRTSTHGASVSSLSKPSLLRRKRALEQQQASPTAVETAAFLSRHRQSLVVSPVNLVQLAANDMLAPGLRHQARRLIQDGPPASFGGEADVGAEAPLAGESSLRPPRSYPLQARGELLLKVQGDTGGKDGFSRLLASTLATQALPSVPTALAVCASADLAAVGLRSGQILLLEASTHRILDTLSGHVGEVTALAFAAAPSSAGAAVVPGGPYLYSTSVDNLAFAWDVANRRPLATSRKHRKRASACAAAPDGGGVFATAGWDGEVYIFRNNRTRQFTHATKGKDAPAGPVTATEFCPWQPELLAYASWDRYVYIYDTAKQELVHKMRGHSSSIRTLTWVEDGPQGVRHLASLDAGGSVVLWDAAVGRSVGRFVAHRERGSHVMAIGHALVTTSGAGVVRLWRPSPGLPTAELSAPRMAQPGADTMALAGPARRVRTVSNAAGQTLILTAHHDGSIALAGANAAVEGASADGEANEAEAHLRATFTLPPPGGHSAENTEITAAFAAMGDATCRSGGRANFQAHKMPVVALDASFTFFNNIKDAAGRPSSVRGEPEGGLLTVASASGDGELVLWTANLSSGKLIKAITLAGNRGSIHDVALDPNGRGTLVSVGDDRMVHVWILCVDTETEDAEASAPPTDSGLSPRVTVLQHHELAFHEGAATGVVFGVSGKFFVTCGRDGHLAVWSSVTRDIVASVKQAHSDWIHAVDISLNEKWVASVGNDGLCRLWHIQRQGVRDVLLTAHKVLSGHDLAPSMVAFCRTAGDSYDKGLEEDLLATASADGGIRVWSARDGAAVASLRVDTGDHGAAALSWLTSTASCSRPPGEGADGASSRLLVGLPSGAARFYAPRAPLLLSERTLGHGPISAVGKRRLPDGEERVLVACHDRSLHELCVPPADVHAAAADKASLAEPAKHTLTVDLLGDAQAPLVGLSPVGPATIKTAWRLWRGQFLAPPAAVGVELLSDQVALPAVAAAGIGPAHVVAALPRALVLLAQTAAGLQRVSAVTTTVPLTCVAVAPDHGYVAAGGWNGYLVVGSLRNLAEEHEVCGRPQNSSRWVSAVAFAPDGEHLAVLYFDGLLEIWDLQRMALVVGGVAEVPACGLEAHWAVSLAWTALGIFVGCDDGRVAAWGAESEEAGLPTLQQPAFIFDAAPGAGVGAMCSLINGIAVGGTDGVVRLWQVRATGQDGSFDVREVGIFECGAACSSIAAVQGRLLCGDAAGRVHCVQRIPRPLTGPASVAKLRTPIVF